MISKKQTKKQKPSLISSTQKIDYKKLKLLKLFVTKQRKILPRRTTRVTIQQQRKLAKAIKRGRILSLFPFIKNKY